MKTNQCDEKNFFLWDAGGSGGGQCECRCGSGTGQLCSGKPLYGYRQDRSPGRIVAVRLKGAELKGEVCVDVAYRKLKETSAFRIDAEDSAEVEVMLPSALPVDKTVDVSLTVRGTEKKVKTKVTVEPMRHWTVYLYNHSHVDIGYTNTHKNVEMLHKRMLRKV